MACGVSDVGSYSRTEAVEPPGGAKWAISTTVQRSSGGAGSTGTERARRYGRRPRRRSGRFIPPRICPSPRRSPAPPGTAPRAGPACSASQEPRPGCVRKRSGYSPSTTTAARPTSASRCIWNARLPSEEGGREIGECLPLHDGDDHLIRDSGIVAAWQGSALNRHLLSGEPPAVLLAGIDCDGQRAGGASPGNTGITTSAPGHTVAWVSTCRLRKRAW